MLQVNPCAVGFAFYGLQQAAANTNIVGTHYDIGPAWPCPHAPHAGPCMRTPAPGVPIASLNHADSHIYPEIWPSLHAAYLWPCRSHPNTESGRHIAALARMCLRSVQTKCELQFSTSCIKATHALTVPA